MTMQQALKGIRVRAGYTADQLAERLGLTEYALYAFEAGVFTSQRLVDLYGGLAEHNQHSGFSSSCAHG